MFLSENYDISILSRKQTDQRAYFSSCLSIYLLLYQRLNFTGFLRKKINPNRWGFKRSKSFYPDFQHKSYLMLNIKKINNTCIKLLYNIYILVHFKVPLNYLMLKNPLEISISPLKALKHGIKSEVNVMLIHVLCMYPYKMNMIKYSNVNTNVILRITLTYEPIFMKIFVFFKDLAYLIMESKIIP